MTSGAITFGVKLPNLSPLASRDSILTTGRVAERLGFTAVWASDHVVFTPSTEHDHPDRRFPVGFDTPAGPRAIDELSLSQRLAFDLAATFTLVGLHHSVVLFDTPELGLPAGDALRTLYALRDYAPTTQIVVATTDPGILGAHDVRVLRLEAA